MGIDWFGLATCMFSLLAALFWMKSAAVTLPHLRARITEEPNLEAITRQSRWNSLAAVCAATAAVAQAIRFLATLPGHSN